MATGIPNQFDGEPELFVAGSSVGELVLFALNLLFLVNTALAFLFLLYAGIQYITAGGDAGKVESAQGAIRGALIGLVLSALAFSLIQVIGGIGGVDVPSLLNP